MPRCSIVIPVYNHLALTRQCLDVILRSPPEVTHEIIVVDDASTDATPEVLSSYGSKIRVVRRSMNGGFARACNDGAAAALGDYIVFLNNDTVPLRGWLDKMVAYADDHPEAAVVGARMLHPDDTIQHAGVVIAFDGNPRHIYRGFPKDHPAVTRSRRFQVVTGGCALFRREAFFHANGFDTGFVNCYEDVDVCLRLGELGYEIHYCHEAVLYHLESVSREDQTLLYNYWLYRQRWADRVKPDEFTYFFEDGLLDVNWRYNYPIDVRISPLVASVEQEQTNRELYALLRQRTDEVWRLLRRQTAQIALGGPVIGRSPRAVKRRNGRAVGSSERPGDDTAVRRVRAGRIRHGVFGDLVSIVLVVEDENRDVVAALERLEDQKRRFPMEIAVLDSSESAELAAVYADTDVSVFHVPSDVTEGPKAINAAARSCSGDIVALIHSSLVPRDEEWLEPLVARLVGDTSLAAVSSRLVPRDEWASSAVALGLNQPYALDSPWRSEPPWDGPSSRGELESFPFHLRSLAIRRPAVLASPVPEVDPLVAAPVWARDLAKEGKGVAHEPRSVAVLRRQPTELEIFVEAVRRGRAAVELGLDPVVGSEVLSTALWRSREDWDRIREQRTLTAAEREHQEALAVIQRGLQTVGEWLGAHNGSAAASEPLVRVALPGAADQQTARLRESTELQGDDSASGTEAEAPAAAVRDGLERARFLREKTAPLALRVSASAPKRTNLIIPEVNFAHFFGGYITKFQLAKKLSQRGRRVRLITVDHCEWALPEWKEELRGYAGLEDFFDQVEVALAFDRSTEIEVSSQDEFIATTWWTAHIANDAIKSLGRERFLYLIQEYEPLTLPMGTFASFAEETYQLPHSALFSTGLLRDYFQERKLGVFRDPRNADRRSAVFENAITAVTPPTPEELEVREDPGLLFYARPEGHAARNMFELGVLALMELVEEHVIDWRWRVAGIGTLGEQGALDLGHGVRMEVLPRTSQLEYARVLREFDVGLSLMYTPHPSLVPIEMAAAGMTVVTNTYETKTEEKLAEISTNFVPVPPTLSGVREGIRAAVARRHDVRGRVEGAKVRWPKTWDAAFDGKTMDRIEELLSAQ